MNVRHVSVSTLLIELYALVPLQKAIRLPTDYNMVRFHLEYYLNEYPGWLGQLVQSFSWVVLLILRKC